MYLFILLDIYPSRDFRQCFFTVNIHVCTCLLQTEATSHLELWLTLLTVCLPFNIPLAEGERTQKTNTILGY